MMDMDRVLLLLFGGIMIAAVFVVYQFGRLVIVEFKDRASGAALLDSQPLSFSLWLCLGSIGIFGNAAVRVYDGIHHQHFGGSAPVVLAIFLLMIWIAKTGFHWLASRKRRLPWHLYLASIVVWTFAVSWPLIP
jgi:hypothetical protein